MDVMREPGAVIGRGIARGERAETDLDAFISKRHEQRVVEGERAVEEAWGVSERHQEAPAGGRGPHRGWLWRCAGTEGRLCETLGRVGAPGGRA